MLAYFDKLSDCAESVAEIIASNIVPSMMEFLDNTTINCVEDYTGVGLPRNSQAILLIEVDGRGSIVEEDAETIINILKRNNASFVKKASDADEANSFKDGKEKCIQCARKKKADDNPGGCYSTP